MLMSAARRRGVLPLAALCALLVARTASPRPCSAAG